MHEPRCSRAKAGPDTCHPGRQCFGGPRLSNRLSRPHDSEMWVHGACDEQLSWVYLWYLMRVGKLVPVSQWRKVLRGTGNISSIMFRQHAHPQPAPSLHTDAAM